MDGDPKRCPCMWYMRVGKGVLVHLHYIDNMRADPSKQISHTQLH